MGPSLRETCLLGHLLQGFVHLYDLDLITQAGPAAEHVWVFLRDAARAFGIPIAHENVVMIAIAVEQITAVSLRGDYRGQFAKGIEGGCLHFGQGFPKSY
jgi:hypothetical protein